MLKRQAFRLHLYPDVTVLIGMRTEDPVVAELPWLRRLARRLAADDADDLVQDTWLMARRYAPEVRGSNGLRPWLAQTMRNLRRASQRSSIARTRREAQASPTLAVDATAEREAIEADVLRVLEDALAALDEEQRTLVRERFFSERSAVDIARELGVPGATVRTKLRRSLLRLREVLDERHGNDRARWASAVLAVPLSRTVKGGLTMASSKGIIAAGALAGIVTLAWFWAGDRGLPVHAAKPAEAASAMAPNDSERSSDRPRVGGKTDIERTAPGPDARRARLGGGNVRATGASAANATGPIADDPSSGYPVTPARVRNCTLSAVKHDCDFLEPGPLVIEDMATCAVVRYDFPAMFAQRDQMPEMQRDWLDLVGASGAENDLIRQVADSYRDELFAGLEAIAVELGEDPWPTDMTLLDAVMELSEAVGDDNVLTASRIVARERAGQLDPPGSTEGLPAAERFLRLFTDVGNGFETKLAERIGSDRARELRRAKDGWPGLRYQTAARCPD